MKIKYPTWKVHYDTMPCDTLWICPECGKAVWGLVQHPERCSSCRGKKGGNIRCRRGTDAELAEGKRHLQNIIGGPVATVAPPPPPKPKKFKKGEKPLFILRFVGGPYDNLYYSGEHRWQGVDRKTAERLDHTRVRKVQGHLKRHKIEQATIVEPA